ncbi:hypothetical protein QBC39DRAFT_401498 [Podospora conica]|nr:hypothetical protein QBC39DRAFT_401498 [Schizothecium conicum]
MQQNYTCKFADIALCLSFELWMLDVVHNVSYLDDSIIGLCCNCKPRPSSPSAAPLIATPRHHQHNPAAAAHPRYLPSIVACSKRWPRHDIATLSFVASAPAIRSVKSRHTHHASLGKTTTTTTTLSLHAFKNLGRSQMILTINGRSEGATLSSCLVSWPRSDHPDNASSRTQHLRRRRPSIPALLYARGRDDDPETLSRPWASAPAILSRRDNHGTTSHDACHDGRLTSALDKRFLAAGTSTFRARQTHKMDAMAHTQAKEQSFGAQQGHTLHGTVMARFVALRQPSSVSVSFLVYGSRSVRQAPPRLPSSVSSARSDSPDIQSPDVGITAAVGREQQRPSAACAEGGGVSGADVGRGTCPSGEQVGSRAIVTRGESVDWGNLPPRPR